MPISITGTGTITGLSAGGLPDDCITTAEIAGSAVTPAKLSGAQTGSAPIYGARAWVNFDGTKDTTGATSTSNTNRLIRGSGNVSSVLRNGLGDYTVNFTVAMPDENYSVAGVARGDGFDYPSTVVGINRNTAQTASLVRIYTGYTGSIASNGGNLDSSVVCVSILR
jgi:hypothetical protein